MYKPGRAQYTSRETASKLQPKLGKKHKPWKSGKTCYCVIMLYSHT